MEQSGSLVTADQYLRPLFRYWYLILALMLIGGGLGFAASALLPDRYEATASVLVTPATDDATQQLDFDGPINIPNEIVLAASNAVVIQVAEDLAEQSINIGTSELSSNLSIDNPRNSSILEITYSAADADVAPIVANSFANNYIEHRSALIASELTRLDSDIQLSISRLKADLSDVEARLSAVVPDSEAYSSLLIDKDSLEGELRAQQDALASVSTQAVRGGQLIDPAIRPTEVSGASPLVLTVGGIAAGLVLGCLLAQIVAAIRAGFGIQPDRPRNPALAALNPPGQAETNPLPETQPTPDGVSQALNESANGLAPAARVVTHPADGVDRQQPVPAANLVTHPIDDLIKQRSEPSNAVLTDASAEPATNGSTSPEAVNGVGQLQFADQSYRPSFEGLPELPELDNKNAAEFAPWVSEGQAKTAGSLVVGSSLQQTIKDIGAELPHRSMVVLVVGEQTRQQAIAIGLVLAKALRERDAEVLVVDAILEESILSRLLELDPNPGLKDVLLDEIALEDAVRKMPDLSGLAVLPSGRSSPMTGSAFSPMRLSRVVGTAKKQFDATIIVAGQLADAVRVASFEDQIDGVVMSTTEAIGSEANIELQDALASIPAEVLARVSTGVMNDRELQDI